MGVEKLQAALGVTENGTLGLGQAVFEPTAVRVTSVSATLGAPAQPGQPVLSATSTTRQVSIALDAAQQSEVAVGDKVTITLPNNQTTPGVISSVGTVATAPASGSSDSSSDHHRAGEPDRPGRDRDLGPGPGERDDHHRHASPTRWSCPSTPCWPNRAAATRWRWWAPTASTAWCRSAWGSSTTPTAWSRSAGPGLAAGQRVVVPNAMTTDTTRSAMRGRLDDRRVSADGGDRPVLEVDQVTKIYPSEPPVTALRESPSPSTGASWWASWARRGRARPRCCI